MLSLPIFLGTHDGGGHALCDATRSLRCDQLFSLWVTQVEHRRESGFAASHLQSVQVQ